MDWSGIWSGVFSNAVYGLLILAGGAALATTRLKWPQYSDVGRNALMGAACVAIILFAFVGHGFIVKQPPRITPDNVEQNVKSWVEEVGLSMAKMPQTNDVYFGYAVTLKSGAPILVYRGKDKAGYLQIQCPLTMSDEHLGMLNKLTKEQADEVMEEITLEMNRSRIGFVMGTTSPIPFAQQPGTTMPAFLGQTIIVTKPIAISEISQPNFIARLDEMDSEIGIVRGITDLTLKRYSRPMMTR